MKPIIVAALLTGAQAHAAAPPPCITYAEFNDMSRFMLPAVIEGAAAKCQASLPADAYLPNAGRALAARLSAASDVHKAGAIAAFARIGGGRMPEGLSLDTMAGLMRDMAKSELFKKVTAEDCVKINEAAELLAPLPPENIGGLLRLLVELGGKKGKAPPFRFCPAVAQ